MTTSLEETIGRLPAGLDRAILRILSFHVGRSKTISRTNLVHSLRDHGFDVHERMARAQINQLRKQGHLICSTGGSDGGYYLASNWNELDEYLARELHSRAMDLLEQEKSLRKEGEKRFGGFSPSKQGKLF